MIRSEIVVGLDDSPSGRAALCWAAEQAIRTPHRIARHPRSRLALWAQRHCLRCAARRY